MQQYTTTSMMLVDYFKSRLNDEPILVTVTKDMLILSVPGVFAPVDDKTQKEFVKVTQADREFAREIGLKL